MPGNHSEESEMTGLRVLMEEDIDSAGVSPREADGWINVDYNRKTGQYMVGTRIVGHMPNDAMQKRAYDELCTEFPDADEYGACIEGLDFVVWATISAKSTQDGPVELLARLQGVLRRIETEAVLIGGSLVLH